MTQPLRRLFTQARKAKRWSQTQAAQKAGLSLTIVFKAEMQLVTKLHTALALCRIYDIPLDTLAACYWYERGEQWRQYCGTSCTYWPKHWTSSSTGYTAAEGSMTTCSSGSMMTPTTSAGRSAVWACSTPNARWVASR